MNYVIIGNSAAGIGAVEAIRKVDKQGKITVISDEKYHTYSRPLISYLLLGKTDVERMLYRDKNFYEQNSVELLAGEKAVSINPDKKYVMLESGKEVSYDKLLVATGSSPFVPPMKGLEKVECSQSFMKLDDAFRLQEELKEGSKVLIIGAGLIGLKCAEGISQKADVTLVDLADRPLSSILDDEAGALVRKHLENNGLKFRLGVSVAEFGPNEAELTSGEKIPFDVLVLAVGVKPNVSLVKDIGGETGRGITVDNKMQTSISDIYAAGDCTESVDVSDGKIKVMALLPNAYMQGECAGYNMAGEEQCFTKAIPMNAIGFFGLHIVTAGNCSGEVFEKRATDNTPEYKKLFYSDNKLNGFIIIGDIARAGIYTSLVREKTPLDSIDFSLICEYPGLMAFSQEERNKKLGGA